jgi:hypothetical protein
MSSIITGFRYPNTENPLFFKKERTAAGNAAGSLPNAIAAFYNIIASTGRSVYRLARAGGRCLLIHARNRAFEDGRNQVQPGELQRITSV